MLFCPRDTKEVSQMTDTEKNKILELRKLGYGYKKISIEIGVSVNSIRNYCSKIDFIYTCKECGCNIKITPSKKKRKFCSDKCRFLWWNKHRDELNHEIKNVVTCNYCSKKFITFSKSKRVYCSVDCYNKVRCKGGNSNG